MSSPTIIGCELSAPPEVFVSYVMEATYTLEVTEWSYVNAPFEMIVVESAGPTDRVTRIDTYEQFVEKFGDNDRQSAPETVRDLDSSRVESVQASASGETRS